MTSVMRVLFGVVVLTFVSARAEADILLSAAPTTAGPIVTGNSVVFDIFARSTTGNQPFALFGFDLVLTTPAGTPLTDARGGRLTNPATNLLGGIGWLNLQDVARNPAQALFDAQSGGAILSFTDTNVRIATITLATPGATPGNYLMDFRNVVTLTSAFQNIAGTGTPLSYSITAVPEPSSMALLCIASALGYAYRRRKTSKQA